MATCNIKFYKCGLSKSRNAKIDDIAAFLENNNKASLYKEGVQYIRHAMKTSVKVDLSQSEADNQTFDYCTMENEGSTILYCYFVDSCTQTAQRTVQFNLTLDTINTFFDGLEFTDRTYIEREHQDRFEKFIPAATPSRTDSHRRKIHKVSEGNAPLKVLSSKTIIKVNEPNYYLVYRSNANVTSESIGAVQCLAYASEQVTYNFCYNDFITPSQSSNYHTYMLCFNVLGGKNRTNDSITFTNGTNSIILSIPNTDGYTEYCIRYRQGENFATLFFQKWGMIGTRRMNIPLGYVPTKITINADIYYYNASPTIDSFNFSNYTKLDISTTNVTPKYINQLDKTDSKLIKIIALPYPPFRYTEDEQGNANLSSGWIINENNELELEDLNNGFEKPIHVFDFQELQYTRSYWGDSTAMRDDGLESKIYHSDFYQRTLVYDSFSRSIDLERLKRSSADGSPLASDIYKVTVYFKPSNTINSKFAFNFRFFDGHYIGYYWLEYDMKETFENYLICERNNEVTIYSNNYINYLRTGYNYDIKNKNLQTFNTLFNGAASLASSIGMGAISGNYAGAAIGAASTIASTITSAISQQNAFEQKQAELKQQKTGVSGSNDLDLLEYYSQNKAFDCVYQVSNEQKNNFLNLFYYCGYAIREMRKPTFNTRYWFNFLQCKPQFTNIDSYITNDYLADIEARLEQGVTIYHNHNATWDYEQILENWETWQVR